MKVEQKQVISRDKAADLLLDLAAKIKDGKLALEGSPVSVPGTLQAKLKFRQKDERVKLKVSMSWPAAGEVGEVDRILGQYQLPAVPPADFKQLKKEMQHSLYYFKRLLESGQCPSAEDLAKYKRLQAAFAGSARPQWHGGVAEADRATELLALACEEGNVAGAGRAIEELLSIKKKYHDAFK